MSVKATTAFLPFAITTITIIATAVVVTVNQHTHSCHDKHVCTQTTDVYGTCAFQTQDVTNSTHWWYEHIYPYIPVNASGFYEVPFGGSPLVSFYEPLSRQQWVDEINEAGVRWQGIYGRRHLNTRSPIHSHDHGAMTVVLSGYATFFIEGEAPQTFYAGQAFYHPTSSKRMTLAVLQYPEISGEAKTQSTDYINTMTVYSSPGNRRAVIMLENDGFDWRSNVSAPFWRCPNARNPPTFVGRPNCSTPWIGNGSSYQDHINYTVWS